MKLNVVSTEALQVVKKQTGIFNTIDEKGQPVSINWYKVHVVSSDDLGSWSCNQEVFDSVQEGKKYNFVLDIYSETNVKNGNSVKQKFIKVL